MRIPRAQGAVAAADFHRLLSGADDDFAAGDVGTILRLAADRFRHLSPLRPQAHRAGRASTRRGDERANLPKALDTAR